MLIGLLIQCRFSHRQKVEGTMPTSERNLRTLVSSGSEVWPVPAAGLTVIWSFIAMFSVAMKLSESQHTSYGSLRDIAGE